MPNPQEITQETREALARLGFESPSMGNNFTDKRGNWIWQPGSFSHHKYHWLADRGHGIPSLWGGAGVLFDDPIAAATWLLIESANHG